VCVSLIVVHTVVNMNVLYFCLFVYYLQFVKLII
jgi:hypothetical protein